MRLTLSTVKKRPTKPLKMRLLIGITTLSRQNQGSNKHIKNEIKMQQTRKIRIEEIRTEKSRIEKIRTGRNRKKV